MRQFDYTLSPIDPLIVSGPPVEKRPTKHSPEGAEHEPLTKEAAEHAITKSYKKLTLHHTVVNPKTKQ